jgi:FkbM family methyltransferase|tara:strand:- start:292 stop:1035 length:744 start_codon:yes stop_codon:yes gene_type:complete
MFILRIKKLLTIIFSFDLFWLKSLIKYRLAPTIEHKKIIKSLEIETFIDIGANKGQFAMMANKIYPNSTIICFEPQKAPFETLQKVFKGFENIKMFQFACGSKSEITEINVSNENDSSSILNITNNQKNLYPSTFYVRKEKIKIVKIEEIINLTEIKKPIFLKIDTQGYELEILKGINLNLIKYVYVECSYIELYEGQPLFHEIKEYLENRNFYLKDELNTSINSFGKKIQSDFLFIKKTSILENNA